MRRLSIKVELMVDLEEAEKLGATQTQLLEAFKEIVADFQGEVGERTDPALSRVLHWSAKILDEDGKEVGS
jgi:hypothetical protein